MATTLFIQWVLLCIPSATPAPEATIPGIVLSGQGMFEIKWFLDADGVYRLAVSHNGKDSDVPSLSGMPHNIVSCADLGIRNDDIYFLSATKLSHMGFSIARYPLWVEGRRWRSIKNATGRSTLQMQGGDPSKKDVIERFAGVEIATFVDSILYLRLIETENGEVYGGISRHAAIGVADDAHGAVAMVSDKNELIIYYYDQARPKMSLDAVELVDHLSNPVRKLFCEGEGRILVAMDDGIVVYEKGASGWARGARFPGFEVKAQVWDVEKKTRVLLGKDQGALRIAPASQPVEKLSNEQAEALRRRLPKSQAP